MPLLYHPEKEGPGVSKTNKKGFFDCFSILISKFRFLVLSNMLFFATLIPFALTSVGIALAVFPDTNILHLEFQMRFVFQIMLIPLPFAFCGPFVAGLCRLTRDTAREVHVFIAADFFATAKRCLKKSLIVSIIDYFFYVAAAFALMVYWGDWVFFAVALLTTLYYTLMQKYIFLMVISLNLGVYKMYKNAFLLVLVEFKKSMAALGIFLVSTVFLIFNLLLSMYSPIAFISLGLILLLVHFSIPDLFINYYCFKAIINTVVDPYYKEHPTENETSTKEKPLVADVEPTKKPDKYQSADCVTERSDYVYENGKLVRRDVVEKERLFKDDK